MRSAPMRKTAKMPDILKFEDLHFPTRNLALDNFV
jgi:hypothetical protein